MGAPSHATIAHVSEYSLGNKNSNDAAGNRRETVALGVADASRPSETTSFNTRLAVRSGRPVIRAASPRSNWPRINASWRSRAHVIKVRE